MVNGFAAAASASFSTVRICRHVVLLSAVQPGGLPSCQQLKQMAWANCCSKSSGSSLLLHSNRNLCRSEFGLDRTGRGLKLERLCPISGFRVYLSRRRTSPPQRRVGFAISVATDRWGRLAWRSGGWNSAFRSWIFVLREPPLSPLGILSTITRSLKKEAHEGSGVASSPRPVGSSPKTELEKLPRSNRQATPAKGQARITQAFSSSSSKSKVLHRSAQLETWSDAETSATFDIKSKTQAPGRNEEARSGSQSMIERRQYASWEVDISCKKSGGKVVTLIDIPMPNTPKRTVPKLSRTSSKEPQSWTSSRFSGKAAASTIAGEEAPQERVGLKVMPTSSSVMKSQELPNGRKQVVGETPRQQTDRKRKMKDFPVEVMLRRDLNMCSKDGDVLRALEIYDRSVSDGIVTWNQYNFNILLYLCSSAALGTLTVRKSGTDMADAERLNLRSPEKNVNESRPIESTSSATLEKQNGDTYGKENANGPATSTAIVLSPEVMEMAARRGFEIFEDMKKQQVPPNEATLTAVARLAVKTEDGDLAFQMVKEMAAMNIAPKLRSYSPALVTFCTSKAVEKAFEVDAHMVAAGVQPEEPEMGSLLYLCVELGLEKEVYSLLHRLRARVRALSPTTVASIEEWFSGQTGASAGKENKQPEVSVLQQAVEAGGGGWHGLGWLGEGKWKLDWTTIDSQGFCCSCRKQLVTIDLDPKETENFAQSVSELAFARETKSLEFKKFQDWLERHGPFDAVIDGANVGLYNQNFLKGGFNFFQLNAVAKTALDKGLVKRPPLIVLHHARTKFGTANSPLGQQLLKKWSSSNTLYTTPNGSNDDWYWLYAAVRNKCLLITNDEMRDHLFQLLGNDFFPRWKERHQVRFSATSRGPQFHLPPPYSLVIQESENGSWHIPKSNGDDVDSPQEWLCVTRPGSSSNSDASPDSGLSTTRPVTVKMPAHEKSHDMAVNVEKDQTVSPQREDSSEFHETTVASTRPKRSRVRSPSTILRKLRAVDKKSDSVPVMFDI